MTRHFAKIGAIFYILWGILHFQAAWGIYQLGIKQGPGMAQGRLWQDAFFLFLISVASIYIAAKYNWRNNPLGYWLNFFIIGIEDLLFIFLIVVPGYVPAKMIFTGPLLWILGLIFTTIAFLDHKKSLRSRIA
ncbi:hypothetical protein N9891_01620 [bacterium]|nr:hypothetical protein [bacterium]